MASPRVVNVDEIKSKLLHPATTSHFVVSIPKPPGGDSPGGFDRYLASNGIPNFIGNKEKLELLCCEAILPGSQLATHSITGDYHGSTHKHAYRRQFDDRIDLSFYVDADNYLPIRFFETWIKYIVGEQLSPANNNVKQDNYFYRMNYPNNYIAISGLEVTKFEKSTVGNSKGKKAAKLQYLFVDAFPIAINSMPVSYDTASLLKCSVAFSYVRYYINPVGSSESSDSASDSGTRSSNGAVDGPFTNPNFGQFGVDKTGIESPATFLPGQFGTNSNIPSFTTFVPGQSRFTGSGGPAELAQINRDIG